MRRLLGNGFEKDNKLEQNREKKCIKEKKKQC